MDDSDSELQRSAPQPFSSIRYCAEGVKNDFQKVVDRFLSNESVRFADFLQIWREMHFCHIFRGRQTKSKLKEFAEECLTLACELWIDSADFQVQVCGLYLLYGLYFCQPVEPKSRIRMTLPMWHAVQDFLASVKEFQHSDVEYVFMKLLLAKAFHFVATVSKENSVQDFDYRRKKMLHNEERGEKATPTLIQDLLEPDNILKFEVIDQQYQQMKRNLTGNQGLPDLSLSVIQTDLVDAISDDVRTFRSRRLGVVNAPVVENKDDVSKRVLAKQQAVQVKPFTRQRRRVLPHRVVDKNDQLNAEDAAAMNAAALLASRKPGFSCLEPLTDLSMTSVVDVGNDGDKSLVIDTTEANTKSKTPGKRSSAALERKTGVTKATGGRKALSDGSVAKETGRRGGKSGVTRAANKTKAKNDAGLESAVKATGGTKIKGSTSSLATEAVGSTEPTSGRRRKSIAKVTGVAERKSSTKATDGTRATGMTEVITVANATKTTDNAKETEPGKKSPTRGRSKKPSVDGSAESRPYGRRSTSAAKAPVPGGHNEPPETPHLKPSAKRRNSGLGDAHSEGYSATPPAKRGRPPTKKS